MARLETILRLFIASPSDVSDERDRAAEVINEINITVGRMKAVRVELVSWENSTFPSVGADGQDVINRQINDEYDIFVGLMWTRFGTETGRYNSGTEEEFHRAINRIGSENSISDIMFYFKDEHVSPSKTDWEQVRKVQDFKSQIQKKGTYTWDFSSVEDFERAFRTHLTKRIIDYTEGDVALSANLKAPAITADATIEEPGAFDLMAEIEEMMPAFVGVVEAIAALTEWINERINFHTEETNKLSASGFGTVDRNDATKIINASADDLNKYADGIDGQSSEFSEKLGNVHRRIVDLLAISREMGGEDYVSYRQGVVDIRNIIFEARQALDKFSGAIESFPRLTSKMNAAKRRVMKSNQAVSDQMEQAVRLLDEALSK